MEICFATNNRHKVEEVSVLLPDHFRLLTLGDIGCREELPEEQNTLEGNSLQKASYVFDRYGIACIADDTGLEVSALHGAPGVYSARYAGPKADSQANMEKLLRELSGISDRTARFRTVITLIHEGGEVIQFEGAVKGEILTSMSGTAGFGYDPIFKPEGFSRTFAEMAADEKNEISHRGRAIRKLISYLKSNGNQLFSPGK